MAISAPVYSSQYADYVANPTVKVKSSDWGSKLRTSYAKLTFTAAGFTTAAAGDLFLIKLPPGRVRLHVDLCRLVCPAGTATSDLDIGWAAYTGQDGVAVAASGAGLADSLDVGGGALDQTLPLPTAGYKEFDSQSGVDIVASFDTANSPASGDLTLSLVYSIGN